MAFTKEELSRYARHFVLPNFGVAAQEKLKNARVLVVGAGGLGCPMLIYLAAAGVGHIGIIDGDLVDVSNLQRQVLYTTRDIGKSKAKTARKKILAMNPYIHVKAYPELLTKKNALKIITDYDIVADGTDNFPTRYLVNDACVILNKINVYASIFQYEGQVSVFNYPLNDGSRSPNYRDVFPTPPPPGLVPDCAEGGVLGVLPGIIGSMQANEVIKVITRNEDVLAGKLFMFDALSMNSRLLQISKNKNLAPITELIDYDLFCGVSLKENSVKEISAIEFKKMIADKKDFQLIDVREPFEYEIRNLGGELIPLTSILDNADKISKTKQVIVHCKSGSRSKKAIEQLEKLGFENLFNLTGGIESIKN